MRLVFGSFVIDTAARQLLRDAQPLRLRRKAFDLLELLIENRPRAVSKARIREQLWPGTHVVEGNLHVLAANVRRALEDDPKDPQWVRTVPGFGYAFSGEATSEDGIESEEWTCRVIFGKREIVLRPGENVIGRSRSCAVWIDDASVSRRHAVIHVGPDGVLIEDSGSRNGTFRRDERLQGVVRLEDRDAVAVGSVLLVVRVLNRDEGPFGGGSALSTAPVLPAQEPEPSES